MMKEFVVFHVRVVPFDKSLLSLTHVPGVLVLSAMVDCVSVECVMFFIE